MKILRKNLCLSLAAALAFALHGTPAAAQFTTFTNDNGTGDGLWGTVANWDNGLPELLPAPNNIKAFIGAGATALIDASTPTTALEFDTLYSHR